MITQTQGRLRTLAMAVMALGSTFVAFNGALLALGGVA